ncbi:MAG: hypothetical protein CM15mP3_04440 [Candidatus Poseidoniales archaeon]|nr:MAG: hypothetical protein CM15mP3_04440 [Candidatus Poseidoniales archaeon]
MPGIWKIELKSSTKRENPKGCRKRISEKKGGKKELKVPDLWDMDFYKKCVLEMASSTGVANFYRR